MFGADLPRGCVSVRPILGLTRPIRHLPSFTGLGSTASCRWERARGKLGISASDLGGAPSEVFAEAMGKGILGCHGVEVIRPRIEP